MILLVIILAGVLGFQAGAAIQPCAHCPPVESCERTPPNNPQVHPASQTPDRIQGSLSVPDPVVRTPRSPGALSHIPQMRQRVTECTWILRNFA